MNIFIPSKGRATTSQLLKFASEQKFTPIVVVEPQEQGKYLTEHPLFNYIVLPINNGGITYVRNYIKSYSEEVGMETYWQLDDDITGLFTRDGQKLNRSGFEVLSQAGKRFIELGVALGGLEYRQFAWSATKELIENTFCDSCVFVDNNKIRGFRYRPYLEGKEDRDFAMQVIKSGQKTGRLTTFAFSAPANGSNAGGLKETFYDAGKEPICVQRMVETWGENICVPITKENGRPDVKILWNKINDNQISLF